MELQLCRRFLRQHAPCEVDPYVCRKMVHHNLTTVVVSHTIKVHSPKVNKLAPALPGRRPGARCPTPASACVRLISPAQPGPGCSLVEYPAKALPRPQRMAR